MNYQTRPAVFRVAYPASTELDRFDPACIQWANQYVLLENLYSSLVREDIHGDLEGAVAAKYYWKHDEIHFEIRNDFIASDGLPVTAEDRLFLSDACSRLIRLRTEILRNCYLTTTDR